MSRLLFETHRGLGYLVVLLFLVVIVLAFRRARDAKEFSAGPFVASTILLDVQVLLGLVFYGLEGYWESPDAMVAYVHPALAIGALVVAHATLRKARAEPMAVASHRKAARGFILALLLSAAAVAIVVVL